MISNELLKKKIIEHYLYEVNYKKQQLKEIAEFKSGKTPQSTEICKSGNIPYYKVSDMNLVENKVYMNKNINYLREIGSYKLFPKHSIIFPKNGGALLTNKKRILTVDSLVDLNTGVLIPNEKIFYKYLYYFMLLVDFKYYFKGTALPTIDSKKFLEIIMPVPPLEEQKKIVKTIEELFELIDKKEKNDKEKEKLKTLLTEKILDSAIHGNLVENDLSLPAVDVEEIKEENPFEIPSNWKWCNILEVCSIVMGQSPNGKSLNNIKGIEFHQGKKYFGKKFLIASSELTNIPTKIIESNTIVMSVRAPVGDINITPRTICIGRGLCAFISNSHLNNMFLYYLLKFNYKYINSIAKGTTFVSITSKDIKKINFPIPPLEQQKKIVDKIEKCFELIEQL